MREFLHSEIADHKIRRASVFVHEKQLGARLVRLPARADTPALNSFGEAFAGSGHQMPGENLKKQIVETGETTNFFHSLNFHQLFARSFSFLHQR